MSIDQLENEKFTRHLRCPMSQEELLERGDRMARLNATTKELEASLASEVASRKAVIKSLESETNKVAQEIRDRAIYRDVDCERVFDYERKQVRETRLDTNELLFDRPMTFSELQGDLFPESSPAPAEEEYEPPEPQPELPDIPPLGEEEEENEEEEEPAPKARRSRKKLPAKKFTRKAKKAPKVRRK